jgi:flagellar hook-length control protein FliK
VSAAHIVNQSGQTEIRIELQADSLGGVELRAHIAGDQIGASIAVEHHDAQVALAMDLPALHSALAEKNLRLETLTVSQGHFSSLNSDPGQDPGHKGFAHSPAKFAYAEQPEQTPAFSETPAEWNGSSNSSGGLSVVA